MPVYALGLFLRTNASNISFNIVDVEKSEEYYLGNQKGTVISQHVFPFIMLPWYLGIGSGDDYLRDAMNPNNRIPVSQLRWSKDGQN